MLFSMLFFFALHVSGGGRILLAFVGYNCCWLCGCGSVFMDRLAWIDSAVGY